MAAQWGLTTGWAKLTSLTSYILFVVNFQTASAWLHHQGLQARLLQAPDPRFSSKMSEPSTESPCITRKPEFEKLALLRHRLAKLRPDLVLDVWDAKTARQPPATAKLPHLIATKFGGTNPWRQTLAEGGKWPKCKKCGDDKTFVCQINVKDTPDRFREQIKRQDGLFQLFLVPSLPQLASQ